MWESIKILIKGNEYDILGNIDKCWVKSYGDDMLVEGYNYFFLKSLI